ncbi:RNAse III [Fontimonas thermophila]|uniref:Ribonuclease 3 n=1 Tax=Fontimonas thermophila TaxID=1076937 RepID=A0A1I2JR93_9GAMM|nr:ribonuclease III [Fontimonas thermophila]SFF55286.1 RNAse III [Fontimonas thermophila]
MNASLEVLQEHLGHRFTDTGLLERALSHRSLGVRNNERLEFLGDALINFVAADALYAARPTAEEGALSRLRASLVREAALARIARDLDLGAVIRLGESELKSGGFRRDSILADAVEAILGAVYLDGGFAAARAVALRLLQPLIAELPDAEQLKDAKTRLQEWLQARSRPLPRYEVLAEEGPPHARRFHVCCVLPDTAEQTRAEGPSRRSAEQQAAEAMLQRLEAGVADA